MASKMLMEQPLCLVGNGTNGELEVKPKALEILYGITQPVVVVSIVGLYRTGKSYLMNQLAGKKRGFPLGSTVQSQTKGIWMWCLPHPRLSDYTLVLLDTEGLGDVEKGNTKNDNQIFALTVLLSSTLVYNSKGTIDEYAMEQLHFVTTLSEHIKVKAQEGEEDEEGCQFVRFFPCFIWAVRDFTLELKINEHLVTEDDYLENALKFKKAVTKGALAYNLPRECIKSFFPTRKCFVFVQPAPAKDISQLELLPESSLDPQFLEKTRHFCQHVLQSSPVKTVKGGHPVSGQMLGSLVQCYVETLRSGKVPCMDNAVVALAALENEAAVQEGLAHYISQMKQLKFPVDQEELSEKHGETMAGALGVFMDRSFRDEGQKYLQKLKDGIKENYGKLLGKNEVASKDACFALLEELSAPMQKRLSDNVYNQPGGYEAYIRDRNQVVEDFRKKPKNGVKVEDVLEQFLVSKKAEAEAVLKFDTLITDMEKHLADGKQKAELLEQQRRAEEERRMRAEQLVKDQERSFQEYQRQLETKLAEEAATMKKEAQKALECKLKEQGELLQQGFREKSMLMEQEISTLKREINSVREQDFVSLAKNMLKVFSIVYDICTSDDNSPFQSRSQAREKTRKPK
ncbi:guanylate-binding protein 1-like [Alligator sinensis]|uniref:Guanylate-binding protein 1-like n=1 Tax=Alligator sinensis TaxID=38654 RepID=A0A1U8DMQ4_ALLSI|nr:guanylate-binding protein 1-like [Alligator sinensis]XP_014382502.1 guanylate-binding protein 1-like [Alligator sinensis]XP_025050380.1 guanylate-binding protein 1-like [Alligator sinensis]XP_025050381.1 guanylate-binding protein 1-like [Alligator sinensis]